MLSGVVLDHVAVATESWPLAWPLLVTSLGGEWASGGLGVGFAPSQLRFGNGARLEVLQPWRVDENPFLRRFLDASGPGPHHLTFKVPDLDAALAAAAQAGFVPVSVDRSDPGWMEAFLHPRQAAGVVVQLAQAAGSWQSPPPEGFPVERPDRPADLTHVTHAVATLAVGLALFRDLLGGEERHRYRDPHGDWEAVTLGWGGPLLLRLVAPAGDGRDAPAGGSAGEAIREWLGGRPGRVHHVAFSHPGSLDLPGTDAGGNVAGGNDADGNGGAASLPVPGAGPDERPLAVIGPTPDLGTRVVLWRADGAGDPPAAVPAEGRSRPGSR